MLCVKCRKDIPDSSAFCCYCGKKQTAKKKKRTHKRAHGTGTISKDTRYKNQYIAHAPAIASGSGRVYLGAFPTMAAAQKAIDEYLKHGRPELYNATVEDIYKIWSENHFKNIMPSSSRNYKTYWEKFAPISSMKMSDLRTAHLQMIVNGKGVTPQIAYEIKVIAKALCKIGMENDLLDKNYAEFLKLPKIERKEKVIFTADQLKILWDHSDDEKVQTILVMVYMGFRVGEVLQLKTENIHLDEGYIIGGEKTEAGRNRVIPFPPEIPEIKEFVSHWLNNADSEGNLFSCCYATFCRDIFYTTLIDLKIVDGYVDDNYKVKFNSKIHITPHSTRHTFASLSSAAGMRPENLQKIIGHANYQTTANIYIHQDIAALQSEMCKLKK